MLTYFLTSAISGPYTASGYYRSCSSWTQFWRPMHATIRPTLSALASATALLVIAAAGTVPLLAHAADPAPGNVMQASSSTILAARSVLPGTLALKPDDFKETDLWGRLPSGYA